jgi:hypothetical protein
VVVGAGGRAKSSQGVISGHHAQPTGIKGGIKGGMMYHVVDVKKKKRKKTQNMYIECEDQIILRRNPFILL